ncbi:hypothetical protein [Streptomyces sp. CBMA152]|uniref:hypothetical protein n=1 Tax=Streptomyces sp. CBMA152 TaxID=1896312 RepID=UPI0016615697|nr:hypothetical protein [Streptomyces sp. CBMA152]MBD0747512.1 hypothetical protein [Streptomyces sp. CBMA152]
MRLRNALAIGMTAATALSGTSAATADESEPRGRHGHASLFAANQPVCGDKDGRDFPFDTRIHGGPAEYHPGDGAQVWYVDLTNTTARTCRNIHPVVVLVDRDRTLKNSQAKMEFFDTAAGRPHPVPFERTDEDEHIGVFDDGFPGFVIGARQTVTIKVRLGFTADTRANQVTVNAAVVQRRGDSGEWVGESGGYRFGIAPPGAVTPRAPELAGLGDQDDLDDFDELAETGTGSPVVPGAVAGGLVLGGGALVIGSRRLRLRRR